MGSSWEENGHAMIEKIHGRFWDTLWDNMKYWERNGNDEKLSLEKAFYWDFVEIWTFDKSWDDDKKAWCRFFHVVFPECREPSDSM